MREAVLLEVFLDLQKEYNVLDQDICLDILAEYGVGSRTIRFLRMYRDRLTMVARAGGYFGLPLKGYHNVTLGDPCTRTIFNVVIDSVIHHWVMVVRQP